ncbi:MAG: c-type cytochrome [Verrucomicrobia bacterium]|nr:c-type cytochrome [Verrucomicrobiota bacterium]
MKTYPVVSFALLAFGLVAGCDSGSKSGRGFKFPEGDAARGRAAFVELKCVKCHRVDGVDGLPAPTESPDKVLTLGGEVVRLRTYGDLVTAVIHPSAGISEKYIAEQRGAVKKSPMEPVNDSMTVAQMLDIVTFLHPRYKKLAPLYEFGTGP